jgi:hypothetical protein
MRRILLSALFCSFLLTACSPPDKCPRTDDLSKDWILESSDPKNKIAVSWQCPQTISISLHSKEPVYAGRISLVDRKKPISVVGTFTSLCDPDDGIQTLGILEDGSKVAYQESKLLTQKLRADYVTISNEVTYLAGVQANHPCEVDLQLVVNQ